MAETEPPKRLIIKLRLPQSSQKRKEPSQFVTDSCGDEKRRKTDGKYSRTMSEECESKRVVVGSRCKKMMEVATEHSPEKSSVKESKRVVVGVKDSRTMSEEYCAPIKESISRTPSNFVKENNSTRRVIDSTYQYCEAVKKNNGVECKKLEETKKKAVMDRFKKMQCWAIVKRMMVGRDGWALKQPLDVKVLEDNILHNDTKKVRAIGLEDIEGKVKKWMYSNPDEFANDMRFVFSHALLYPPKSETHRIARRLSHSFEITWKSLKDKWALEDRKRKTQNRCL